MLSVCNEVWTLGVWGELAYHKRFFNPPPLNHACARYPKWHCLVDSFIDQRFSLETWIVYRFGIKISGFTPSSEALGRKKKMMTKVRISHMSIYFFVMQHAGIELGPHCHDAAMLLTSTLR